MVIDQLESGTNLNKILKLLRKRFGIDLRLHESTQEEVEQILEYYENVKHDLMLSESFNTTFQHPEYAKAMLICEACKLFLSEISPARQNAKVRTKKQQKAEKVNEAKNVRNFYVTDSRKIRGPRYRITSIIRSAQSEVYTIEVGRQKITIPSKQTEIRFTDLYRMPTTVEYVYKMMNPKAVTEDLDPEIESGKDFDEDGITFDGEDHTNDYRDDRDPSDPKAFDFDYEEKTTAVSSGQGIDPEIDPLDTEKSFTSMAKDDESGVVDRYEIEPKLSPDDYMDDRDPDTDGAPENDSDPMEDLRNAGVADTPETLTGLDPSLETNMVDATPTMVGTGIKAPFNNDPSKSQQRDIPSPTDLQKGNNKLYNNGHIATSKPKNKSKNKTVSKTDKNDKDDGVKEEIKEAGLALAWINKVNTRKYYNKILEAAQDIATERDEDIIHILNAVENHGRRYANSRNDEYTLGMVEALGMLGDIPQRQTIMEARSTNDKQRKLFNKLLNKSRSFNLSEGQSKRFVYAAHNALFNADLVKHHIL